MERLVLLVVVVLGSLASAQGNETTTLGEVFVEEGDKLLELFEDGLYGYSYLDAFSSWEPGTKLTLAMEILNYTITIENSVALEFTWDLGNVTLQSIYDVINGNCSTKIENLRIELQDTTCVERQLLHMLTSEMKDAVEDVLDKMSRDCVQTWPTLCSSARRHCTTAYEERVRRLLTRHAEDVIAFTISPRITPLDIIAEIVIRSANMLSDSLIAINNIFYLEETFNFTKVSLQPLTVENIVLPWKNQIVTRNYYIRYDLGYIEGESKSRDKSTWGVVRSNVGLVEGSCSNNNGNKVYNPIMCYIRDTFRSYIDLLSCAFQNSSVKALTWLSVPDIYFNSPCLCVAFNGDNCGVKVPSGVDPRTYCISVLLRDLQRRISFRPAVTYLDYSLKTPIPLCNFTNLLSLTSWTICDENEIERSLDLLLSMRCYFKDLVSKDINCSETLPMKTFNHTELCVLMFFMESVLCEDDATNAFSVSYYGVGDSTLVLFFTYLDVAARALTLLSFLACPPLHNLPGKLMMCYLLTALMRLLVVRGLLEDLEWAVRLDVLMDLASTLWLTAYLHFLTTSIKTLRLPNSLSRVEARQVLLSYSLFGWVLPLTLSVIFFCVDEFLDSSVQFGQLLFVLLNYAALLANLYMFFYNCSFYYDVNSSVIGLGLGVRPRNVFAGLFNFALKTSVLSGAGITFRLVLTQIQGLEHFLGYYHVVGTFQGLLLFLLYGCNPEARDFWLSLFRRAIGRCTCPQNTPVNLNSLELAEIPATQSLQDCSSS